MAIGTNGADTLTGTSSSDVLSGLGGDDWLKGFGGNDGLIGGAGADRLDGGDGIDMALYTDSLDSVSVNLATGQGFGGDAQGDTLINMENLAGSSFGDSLTGNDVANELYGLAGNDVLKGGGGADRVDGGIGIDTVLYSDSNVGVAVNLTTGRGFGGTAEGDTLFNIENVVGSAFGDSLTGSEVANELSGSGGGDVLDGRGGADRLDGGDGIDVALYDQSAAGVNVNLTTGRGLGGTAEGDTLVNIENVVGSSFSDTLTGDAGANLLSGRSGSDVLIGGGGNDTLDGGDGDDTLKGGGGADALIGGQGNDTADYSDATAAVFASLGGGSAFNPNNDASGDTYFSIENITGSGYGDRLTGDAGNNQLKGAGGNDALDGGSGDDILIGGSGGDVLIGGDGIDTADYTTAAGVHVDLAGGGNTGEAAGDTFSGIENIVGSAYNDDLAGDGGDNALVGAGGNDVLRGGGGNDVLAGGSGADMLIGGAGSDTADYSQSTQAVQVFLNSGSASNGDAQGDTFSSIENITGSIHDDRLVGDDGDNVLNGGNGNDELSGSGGSDILIGGAGNDVLSANHHPLEGIDGVDTLMGGSGNDIYEVDSGDVVIEAAGQGFDRVLVATNHSLAAGSEVEVLETVNAAGTAAIDLVGNEFDNAITGNNGANTIAGSSANDGGLYDGLDVMTGLGGGDLFVWTSIAETVPAGQVADVVTDFNRLEGDLLAVNQIDANPLVAGDQAFTFVGLVDFTPGHQFTGAGQIGFFTTPTDTFILLNTVVNPGPGGIDFEEATIHLTGVHNVDASFFVL